ncbi:hypothetical protein Poli38472_002850 [Pythium oligandrum]|uniref:Uncharacterized protein n=1 Tax=Pythium oligandrum TaxID=41045 RepID=A0A8K1FB58_PYTOL|nr:hypothetical protein Poli38472_002850 [Pythium oligandrum]|eukprot:TMW56925.1 hypothetical protein Poli38472_002850 [Pythium oligandrum]
MGGVVYDVGSWRLGTDGCIHRRGRLKYANGDIYDGEWANGKRHGKGILTFANGSSYIGAFETNLFHGFGVLNIVRTQHPLTRQWVPGERYEGDFQYGKKHGKGLSRGANGEQYDGQFHDGYYHGRGVCAYPNGDVYGGEWVHGKWQGSGELRLQDGSKYVGEVLNGLFHGFGQYTFGRGGRNGSYAGHYRFGLRHGKGRRVFADGKAYDGDWVEDAIHGIGVMTSAQFKYVGEFVHGQFEGHGVMSFANGDSYEGSFKRSEMEGQGVFMYRDGGRYDGMFRVSKREGTGRRVFSNGDSYEGNWRDDSMHGHGVLVKTLRMPKGEGAYRCDGAFDCGQPTGEAVISLQFVPSDADTRFEWNVEYEFPRGSGLWHCGRGESTYEGRVLRGLFHGQGELRSPDGKRWSGKWEHGKLHGRGECVYLPLILQQLTDIERLSTQKRQAKARQTKGLYRLVKYDGDFVENVRHGFGRALFDNGDSVSGRFEKGFAVGIVRYRFSTGRERMAEYIKGQRVRWLSEEEEERVHEGEASAEPTNTQRGESIIRALMA